MCVCTHLISTLAHGFFSAATAEGGRGVEEHSGFPMQSLLWPLSWGKLRSMETCGPEEAAADSVNSWEICPYGWVFPGLSLAAYQSQGAAHPAAHLHQGSWSLAVPVSSPVLDLGAVKPEVTARRGLWMASLVQMGKPKSSGGTLLPPAADRAGLGQVSCLPGLWTVLSGLSLGWTISPILKSCLVKEDCMLMTSSH